MGLEFSDPQGVDGLLHGLVLEEVIIGPSFRE